MARCSPKQFFVLVVVLVGFMNAPALAQDTLTGDVVLTSTFESAPSEGRGGTGGAELPSAEVFGLDAGASQATATVGPGIEFAAFMGLWDIDIDQEIVTFTSVGSSDDPRFAAIASLEGETYDRYYFAFSSPITTNFMTSDPFVLADQGDNGELLVVIEDGYDYTGPGFTVTPIAELPATGRGTTMLVPLALVAVAAGLVLLASSSRLSSSRP